MRIAMTGASGLVGSAARAHLESGGHEVLRLVRREPSGGAEVQWDPQTGSLDDERLAGVDSVIHLAGENIAAGRWTDARKRAIRESRVRGTELLCQALSRLTTPPTSLIAASAIGYYGDRGEETLTEDSPPGSGFLAEVCQAWERATLPAVDAGIRVVNLRIGVVLSRRGGALARMLPPFRLGLGGVVGSGAQYVSWITRGDLVRAIETLLTTATHVCGPVNAVAPQPVTNRELTQALARALRRPAILPVPAFALRLALGKMADELLLASTRALPTRLCESGFTFECADIAAGIRAALEEPQ